MCIYFPFSIQKLSLSIEICMKVHGHDHEFNPVFCDWKFVIVAYWVHSK